MKNLSFTIWMIGYPIVWDIDLYVNEYLLKHTYSDNVQVSRTLICLFIWIFIGFKLYEKS